MRSAPHLRVARASGDLDALLPFYREGLGLEVLFRFQDHDGFDGLMLGREGWPFHLEFTHAAAHPAVRPPGQDDLLVLYIEDEGDWAAAVARMQAAGYAPVASLNPWWDRHGLTFEDPDGCRVVLNRGGWPA